VENAAQTFDKDFLCLSDDFSAKQVNSVAARMAQSYYNLSESGHDARVSSYRESRLPPPTSPLPRATTLQTDFRFDMKTFTELRNAQSITIAYDGLNPIPPTFCYLKPYYNDPIKSYFEQVAAGEL
jgi:hypothetical protein